ncbi:conserved hypothetical protein [Rhodopseudomonas palustris HaA2]|uniref:DUF2798 domain-containing protein n=1 Tax=Rhodopseudomonas palustris (strain HaA2) TaxID=316058 RepID=Q2J0Z3_RHOP2|nr:hypothetical protein [Rhodopseudomonas palustris]ABD05867.1 conserved hypothetical protein [Rhodopseudomonas palustris HaA2]
MSIRFQIAALVYMMINAVVFGVGLVTVMTLPSLARHAFDLIPVVVVASFVLAAPLAWLIAPRLRARFWRPRQATAGR